jgi:hypothetical protein
MFRLWLPKYQKVSKMFNLTKNANNNPATCHFSIKKIINLKTKKTKKKKKNKKKNKIYFFISYLFYFLKKLVLQATPPPNTGPTL